MRVPSYRKHSSGQARVTINGRDHLLGKYGSPASREAYGRLIAEFNASSSDNVFGKSSQEILMQDVLLAYLKFAKKYYHGSSEYANLKLAERPVVELYGSLPATKFGAAEFKAVRAWWLSDATRSRQYVNKQMKRTLRIIKWAVGEGLCPPENYTAVKCVDPLRRGRCDVREAPGVTCVDQKPVNAVLPHMTQVLADMVRFQQLVGCRPGELVRIKPGMVDRSGDVWTITLAEHKTAYRGKARTIYVGPKLKRCSPRIFYAPKTHTAFRQLSLSSNAARQHTKPARHLCLMAIVQEPTGSPVSPAKLPVSVTALGRMAERAESKKDEAPESGKQSIVVADDDNIKIVLFAFAAGDGLAEHVAPLPAIMQIIKCEASLTVGEETVVGKPGTWIHMAAKTPHSVKAQTPVVMSLTLLKSGSESIR
jgi:quercetin dioxygenase-like cupin family protein/integrase